MHDLAWWKTAVVYEIYPRSFQDSNGDGVGDLPGILSRLDYLVEIGIDAIWIAPIFPSPMADFGYDVADYCGIDPVFGTMHDFDCALAGGSPAWPEDDIGFCAQSHFRSAPVVCGEPVVPGKPQARLVPMARSA